MNVDCREGDKPKTGLSKIDRGIVFIMRVPFTKTGPVLSLNFATDDLCIGQMERFVRIYVRWLRFPRFKVAGLVPNMRVTFAMFPTGDGLTVTREAVEDEWIPRSLAESMKLLAVRDESF